MIKKRQREFRDALGAFATGITIITANDSDGRPFGMTANSFASVSLDPPLILWNVGRDAWCYDDFCGTARFTVNVLTEHQQALSQIFATKSRDKFKSVGWHRRSNGDPQLDDCLARFSCATEQTIDGGDHTIIIARVEDFEQLSQESPLIFYSGQYATLADNSE